MWNTRFYSTKLQRFIIYESPFTKFPPPPQNKILDSPLLRTTYSTQVLPTYVHLFHVHSYGLNRSKIKRSARIPGSDKERWFSINYDTNCPVNMIYDNVRLYTMKRSIHVRQIFIFTYRMLFFFFYRQTYIYVPLANLTVI